MILAGGTTLWRFLKVVEIKIFQTIAQNCKVATAITRLSHQSAPSAKSSVQVEWRAKETTAPTTHFLFCLSINLSSITIGKRH